MAEFTRSQEVKSKVSVPMYFYNVILPQRADYYTDYGVDFDAKPVVKCPLHDEDTPSMRYYEETNTFFCFGCRAGGDVIQLHRLFTLRMSGTEPSFDESIDFLYDFFIKGNESAKVIKLRGKGTADRLSSQVEMTRYINYASVLEGQLSVDTELSQDIKLEIWKAIDDTDLLVSENFINAMEAIKYIKEVVRKMVV